MDDARPFSVGKTEAPENRGCLSHLVKLGRQKGHWPCSRQGASGSVCGAPGGKGVAPAPDSEAAKPRGGPGLLEDENGAPASASPEWPAQRVPRAQVSSGPRYPPSCVPPPEIADLRVLTFATTWMNAEDIMLSKTAQSRTGQTLCGPTPGRALRDGAAATEWMVGAGPGSSGGRGCQCLVGTEHQF